MEQYFKGVCQPLKQKPIDKIQNEAIQAHTKRNFCEKLWLGAKEVVRGWLQYDAEDIIPKNLNEMYLN